MTEAKLVKYVDDDPVFKKACEMAGISLTRRQMSKYLNKKGLAFQQKTTASLMLKIEARTKAVGNAI